MKQHFSSRLFLTAIIALFACVQAMAANLNPYAFMLSSTLQGDIFTVTYYLNAPATNITVSIDLGSEKVTYDCTNAKNTAGTTKAKGIYIVPISLRDKINTIANFRNKEDLPWTVDVKGGNTASFPSGGAILNANKELEVKSYNFYNAGSVDIDICPFSDNFGIIYVVERRVASYSEDYYTGQSGENKPGVYVFDPAFQNMPVIRGTHIYNFINGTVDNTRQKAYSFNATDPMGWMNLYNLHTGVRLAYDKPDTEGNVKTRLYCATQSKSGALLMYGNTDKMNPLLTDSYDSWFKKIFNGTRTTDGTYWLTTNEEFVAAPNITFDIQDDAEGNRRLLMASGWPTDMIGTEEYRCDEYNLKNYDYTSQNVNYTPITTGIFQQNEEDPNGYNLWHKNTWSPGRSTTAPQRTGFAISADLLGIEYDKDGKGFWLCQGRDHHSNMPSLTHFKYENGKYVVNFIEYWAGRGKDAVRYDNNHQRLAVSGGPFYIKDSGSSYKDSKFPTKTTTKNGVTYYQHPAAEEGYITIYDVDQDQLKTQFINNFVTEQTQAGTTVTNDERKSILPDSVYLYLGTEANGSTKLRAQDFAWDYADNLYVAMGSHRKIAVFALPKGTNPVSTPCKQSYYFPTPTYLLTINISPANTGRVVDFEFGKEYRYYMKDAKFQLDAIPTTGYRFYCWDEYTNLIGITPTSEHTMTNNYSRTAHFGINVFEDTPITPVNIENPTGENSITFKGVWVKRTLDDASYNTICLPFDLRDLTNTPYAGASVLKFGGAESSSTDNQGDNYTILNFEEVTFADDDYMHAGVPYLIQLQEGQTIDGQAELIFKDVTCPLFTGTPNEYGGLDVTYNGITFHGVMNPSEIGNENYENNLFLVAGNRLANIVNKDEVNILGLRAFFTVDPDEVPGKIQLRLPEKTVTSVPTFSLDTLKPTKYLWNGRIYIQRGNNVYDLSGNCVK